MDENINQSASGKKISLPLAIIIAAVVIGGAILAGMYLFQKPSDSDEPVKPVTNKDYILGSIDAPLKFIIYTDPECPYCKDFHETIKKANAEFGADKVAFVYRLFPLPFHTKSKQESQAALCAGKLGGNEAFWSYMDKIFANTEGNDGLDLSLLPTFAADLNLDNNKFSKCLTDEKMSKKVDELLADAEKAGAQGTPFPVVMYDGEVRGALPGALPYEDVVENDQTIPGIKTVINSIMLQEAAEPIEVEGATTSEN